jgi:hypothetical protein
VELDLGVLLGGDKELLSKAITKFGIVSIRCFRMVSVASVFYVASAESVYDVCR